MKGSETMTDTHTLPPGIRARFVDNGNGLTMHVLEAGDDGGARPRLLLLHGFPELAYSWRKVMPILAGAGYHVIAPDQRGYGRTTGWAGAYDDPIAPFGFFNLVTDALGLVSALGHTSVDAVIGHDFGAPVAACCALIRPDVFPAVVMMSAPFGGTPSLASRARVDTIHDDLAALPRPRKHYQWYYSGPAADADMRDCPQGIHDFLRAYYHHKSADWPQNRPYPLAGWHADALAELPTYYVMDLDKGMAETVAEAMPSPAEIAACQWLTDAELAVYAEAFGRTGFQGGLQWYRCVTGGRNAADLRLFAGRTIDVPAAFIAGRQDWGIYQAPGAIEAMRTRACTRFRGCHLIDGAGHWVQQERPEEVAALLLAFLRDLGSGTS